LFDFEADAAISTLQSLCVMDGDLYTVAVVAVVVDRVDRRNTWSLFAILTVLKFFESNGR
jgi:hypothetical protein